jgi:hypothetical protein
MTGTEPALTNPINRPKAWRVVAIGVRHRNSATVVSHHNHSPAGSSEEGRVAALPQPACRRTARTRSRW